MNVQQAIDLAVAEDRWATFERTDSRDEVLAAVVAMKVCALAKQNEAATKITAVPPSQYICRPYQGETAKLPSYFRGQLLAPDAEK